MRIIDWSSDVCSSDLAQVEIILAMVGRHMDEAGAAVGGDEIAREEGAGACEEAAEMVHRVAGDGAGEVGAFEQLFVFKVVEAERELLGRRFSQSGVESLAKCFKQRFRDEDARVGEQIERRISLE